MQWPPLLYACHTSMHKGDPARLDALVEIARRLCALGADPNGEYHWNWHPELPRTVLWAAVCAVHHLPLAETLLAAGANPTDGVTSHIAGGGGNLDALELLHRYGLNVNGIPAAARLHDAVGRQPGRTVLAARPRRGPEPALGRQRRSATPRRRAPVERRDD
jgi:hypothetical protein